MSNREIKERITEHKWNCKLLQESTSLSKLNTEKVTSITFDALELRKMIKKKKKLMEKKTLCGCLNKCHIRSLTI